MIFALSGNQNCGKTTLFNKITGSNQYISNFPGSTTEVIIGEITGHEDCKVVDLPGIYSLTPYTSEERAASQFIINSKPDVIINVIDAANVERSLYLTLQLMNLEIPVVIALNMMDELRKSNSTVNVKILAERLNVQIIPISAEKKEGIDLLIETAKKACENKTLPQVPATEPDIYQKYIKNLTQIISKNAEDKSVPCMYAAEAVVQGYVDFVKKLELDKTQQEKIESILVKMESEMGMDRMSAVSYSRYAVIDKICEGTNVFKSRKNNYKLSLKIDRILTNKYLAIPIFLLIMFGIFWLTFGVIGAFLSGLLSSGIVFLINCADSLFTQIHLNPVVRDLLVEGVFAGVGSVLSFIPTIVTMFFFLAILEQSGYMARTAFIMDKLLRKIGLSGRAFIPLIIGFGCSVPAIMAAKTLPSERERNKTIMLIPFMNCSAKLPIYAVFIQAFFKDHKALIMMGFYTACILIGILCVSIASRKTDEDPDMFIMELPKYRIPSPENILSLMWDKAKDFLKKAFTVIFLASVIIWFLQSFDISLHIVEDSSQSILAMIGRFVAPIFKPIGFGDWRAATALIAGISGKEATVSTLAVLTGSASSGLTESLTSMFSPISAVSFLIFTLLYTPCVAAVVAVKKETGSAMMSFKLVVYQCAVAWMCSFVFYNIGLLITKITA